jgi:hypothetical protein
MANQVLLKRSATAAKIPLVADLALGELALNTFDGKLFMKKNNGTDAIIEIGAVTSVNGSTGAVVLSTTEVAEGTNLYHTTARAAAAAPVQSVAGRTGAVVLTNADVSGSAPLASPALTGVPTAPTAAASTNTTQLATTAYVKSQNYITSAGAPVQSVAGRTGAVVLTSADVGLSLVENKSSATIRGEITSANVTTALGFTPANAAHEGVANGIATLDANGKIVQSQLPSIALTDTFVVATQAAMLALTAQTGDVAVRTDLNKSFILKGASAATLADWQELLTPTDAVQSVNGLTGSVTLTSSNIAEGTNLYHTTARAAAAAPVQSVAGRSGAVVLTNADVSGSAPLASPAFTGVPTAPTAAASTNNTQVATTAFVKSQGYVTSSGFADGTIDGGTF